MSAIQISLGSIVAHKEQYTLTYDNPNDLSKRTLKVFLTHRSSSMTTRQPQEPLSFTLVPRDRTRAGGLIPNRDESVVTFKDLRSHNCSVVLPKPPAAIDGYIAKIVLVFGRSNSETPTQTIVSNVVYPKTTTLTIHTTNQSQPFNDVYEVHTS